MATDGQQHSDEYESQADQFSGAEAVAWVTKQDIEVQNPEWLAAQINKVVAEFEIDKKVLKSNRNKLLIAAIVDSLGEQAFGEDERASDRVATMIALSFGDTSRLKEAVRADEYSPQFSEERMLAAYDTLTHQERSRELAAYIESDEAFVSLRERLGLTLETQSPFEVRVLSIGDTVLNFGWQAAMDWNENETEADVAERDAARTYLGQLDDNRVFLARELGYTENEHLPPAWVDYRTDGTKLLCLALPTAEKILYPDAPRSKYYDRDQDYARDKSFLLHEFTHTQRPILRSTQAGLGIALEELRAEHFSGDNHGYTEVKRYFRSMQVLFGYSPKQSIESEGAFDQARFETEIAQAMGLDGYLDAMTLIPDTYAGRVETGHFLKQLVSMDRGINGHFETMYDKAIARFGEEEVARRIAACVDHLVGYHAGLGSHASVGVEDVLSYRWPQGFTDRLMAEYRRRSGAAEQSV